MLEPADIEIELAPEVYIRLGALISHNANLSDRDLADYLLNGITGQDLRERARDMVERIIHDIRARIAEIEARQPRA